MDSRPALFGRVVALVGAIGAIAIVGFLAQDLLVSGIVVALVLSVGFGAFVLNRPNQVVQLAVYSMWFDNTGFGQVKVGRIVSAAVVVLFALMYLTSKWRPPAIKVSCWITTAVFFAWCVLSGLWSDYFAGGYLLTLAQLLLGVAYSLTFMWMLTSATEWTKTIRTYVIIGIPIGLIALVMFFTLGTRVSGLTGEPNAFAGVVILSLLLAFVSFRKATDLKTKIYMGIAMPIFVVCVYASGSRSGLISLTVIGFWIAVCRYETPWFRRIFWFAGAAAMGAIGYLFAVVLNPDRFSLSGLIGDRGAGRLDIWQAAVTAVSKSPVVGLGLGSFRRASFEIMSKAPGASLDFLSNPATIQTGGVEAHNMYLTLLLDVGAIGLVLWLVNHFNIAYRLFAMRKTNFGDWGWALLGAHLYQLIGGIFGTNYNSKSYWIGTGFAFAAYYYHGVGDQSDRTLAHLGLPPAEVPDAADLAAAGDPTARRTRISLPWRFGRVAVALVAVTLILVTLLTPLVVPTTYEASARVIVIHVEKPAGANGIEIVDNRIQYVLAMAESDSFVRRVIEMSGLDLDFRTLSKSTHSVRAGFSNVVWVRMTVDDEMVAHRLAMVMNLALESVLDDVRAASVGTSGDGRDISPGETRDFRGPLWFRVSDAPQWTTVEPETSNFVVVGILFSMLVLVCAAMVAHRRLRYSRLDGPQAIPGAEFVGSLTKQRWRGGPTQSKHFRTLAQSLDRGASRAGVIGVTGPLHGRQRACATIGLAAGLADSTGDQVLLIDLDPAQQLARAVGAKNGNGLVDLIQTPAPFDEFVRHVKRRWVSRNLTAAVASVDSMLWTLPLGANVADLDLTAVVGLIDRLATTYRIVIALPQIPGDLSLAPITQRCDVVVLSVIDGWSSYRSILGATEQLQSTAQGRIGFVAVEP